MNSTEPQEKKLKLVTISSDNIPIKNINNCLNNDCLINIFEYLPYLDRLNIEFVCKKWYDLGSKRSWSNTKNLKISKKMRFKYKLLNDSKKISEFVTCIIRRSGFYLNNIVIKNNIDINFKIIFAEILLNCHNISSLSLYGCYHKKREICTEENLTLLFKNNQNLSSIYLSSIFTTGKCLLSVNPNIEELSIDFKVFGKDTAYPDFSKFKNLKKFQASIQSDPNKIIDALNKKNCDKINDLTIFIANKLCLEKFSLLIAKQKALSKVCFKYGYVEEKYLTILPETLQHLEMEADENVLSCLHRFKNLTCFHGWIRALTDNYIKNLTECLNLKEIKIYTKYDFKLTPMCENYFSQFANIESLALTNLHTKSIDYILKIIAKFQNLKELDITGCVFTEEGSNYISLLTDLKILDISFTKINNQQLINLVDRLLNLKKLYIRNCKNLNNEVFQSIKNSLKLNRPESDILKLYYNNNKTIRAEDMYLGKKWITLSAGSHELIRDVHTGYFSLIRTGH